MKKGSYIINVARGKVVDTNAMMTALNDGTLAGAGLNVTEPEPLPAEHPLWAMPNVHIAPHNSAGWDPNLRARQKAIFLDNLGRFARGEPLTNAVDITRGY